MDKNEWNEYIYKVSTWDVPIPLNLINDYDDWKCRSIVGRSLLLMKDVEGAMNVLATVRDVEPDMTDAPEFGFSEAEHKVLCLRDLAEIIWQLTGTADAPVHYLREAYRLCREYKQVFRACDRGKIWVRALELERACGREDEAAQEARVLLEQERNVDVVDTYAFRAWVFLAESAAAKQNYATACEYIVNAYRRYPLNAAAEKDLAEAAQLADLTERYAAYLHCTTIPYQPWERDNVPTLEDVHRLQEENFRRRQAAQESCDADPASLLKKIN